jgi:uncharacterized protein
MMSLPKVVLDTNALLRCVSRRSKFANVLSRLYAGEYELYVFTEILLEYEEKITELFDVETARSIIGNFPLLENIVAINVHFHLGLIAADEEDNKFVDCAFAANAHYLVTNDKHFNVLKSVSFPLINVITLETLPKN